jgi:zinc protease
MDLSLSYDMFELDNGLRVMVHEHHGAPLACVSVWYHVGSKDERPGRTGFAHLFEHLMFEGSEHVPEGGFDQLLEAVGGSNNGSTSPDRTNYWTSLPSHALPLALYLEADRMGGLLPAITQAQLDAQRDVVKNERRQSYENRPYGLASETLLAALYPPDHPYHWPVIGSMADLTAATLDDVHSFGRTHYTPSNATIAVAGDTSVAQVRELVERYFADVPRGPPPPTVHAPPVELGAERRLVLEDNVTLARLYLEWHSPAAFAPGDAELDTAGGVLAGGRAARLYRALVYEQQIAQSVSAYQGSALLGSTFRISITARPNIGLTPLERAVRAELASMSTNGITVRELDRARNGIETHFIDALQTVGGFGGRADQLNMYLFHTGDPAFVGEDLMRYRRLTTDDIAGAVAAHLLRPGIVLSIVPRGRTDLVAMGADG